MSSKRKIESNLRNAKKSTGPKTAQGKSRASGNARRHGWAVVKRNDPSVSAAAACMAREICRNQAMPALYDQAVIIAECETLLLKLRAARVAIIQGNSIIGSMPERTDQTGPDPKLKEAADAIRDLQAKLAQAAAKDSSLGATDHSSLPVTDATTAQWTGGSQTALSAGNDVDGFLRALSELATLERYERRALSRRARAIRMFAAISIVGPFIDGEAKSS